MDVDDGALILLVAGLVATAMIVIDFITMGAQEALAAGHGELTFGIAVVLTPASMVALIASAIAARGRCCCDCGDT